MSAEGLAAGAVTAGLSSGAGVAVAGMMFTADQSLALGALGGCCMFLAASASLHWSSKVLYALGSCIIGYFFGILILGLWSNTAGAAIGACVLSALASGMFGSLKSWSEGGPKPGWLDWVQSFLPAFMTRGKSDE